MWLQCVEISIRYYTETDASGSGRQFSYIQSQKGTTIYLENNNPFGEYLTIVSYTIRSSYYQSHYEHTLPSQLGFCAKRHALPSINQYWLGCNKKNAQENSKREVHTYRNGNYITLKILRIFES